MTDTMYLLRKALKDASVIRIDYTDKQGNDSSRRVEPYEINTKSNEMYAYCLEKESTRLFKIGQIKGAKITQEKFKPRWERYIDDELIREDEEPKQNENVSRTIARFSTEKLIETISIYNSPLLREVPALSKFQTLLINELERRMENDV
jgi:predicted DNA-binding transcriptional regulator YafY